MRKISLLLIALVIHTTSFAGEIIEQLSYFNAIRTSSHINVVLSHGNDEQLRIEYEGVEAEKINYRIIGKTLEIYLEGAKTYDKTIKVHNNGYKQNESYYKGAKVTAYITYKELTGLQLRGDQTAICKDSINAAQFKIKLYGENKVFFAYLNAQRLKGKFYGENKLGINSGKVDMQKFNLYGENEIEIGNLPANTVSVNSYGENKLALMAKDHIRVFGFGDLELDYSGKPSLNRFIIGELKINGKL